MTYFNKWTRVYPSTDVGSLLYILSKEATC